MSVCSATSTSNSFAPFVVRADQRSVSDRRDEGNGWSPQAHRMAAALQLWPSLEKSTGRSDNCHSDRQRCGQSGHDEDMTPLGAVVGAVREVRLPGPLRSGEHCGIGACLHRHDARIAIRSLDPAPVTGPCDDRGCDKRKHDDCGERLAPGRLFHKERVLGGCDFAGASVEAPGFRSLSIGGRFAASQ
jgi:hypothetical protein